MRRTTTLAVMVLTSAVVLSACGSDDDPESSGIQDEIAADAETEPPAPGCTAEKPVAADGTPLAPTEADSGVEVTGQVGEAPEMTVPDAEAPDGLVLEVLEEGDGEPVGACDFISVDYYGQTWVPGDDTTDNVFDQSFDSDEPFRTTLGVGSVIKGWDAALDGITVGSRVLLSVPPEHAYGDEESGHDLGGETLLFVVDVVDRVAAADASVSGEPVKDVPKGLPTVSGEGAEEPAIDFAGAEAPAKSDAQLLVAGDGAEIKENIVVKMLQAPYGDGEALSTWKIGQGPLGRWPNGSPVTVDDLPGLAEALEGQKVGSRVLVRIGTEDNTQTEGEALAIVIDVVGTYGSSSS